MLGSMCEMNCSSIWYLHLCLPLSYCNSFCSVNAAIPVPAPVSTAPKIKAKIKDMVPFSTSWGLLQHIILKFSTLSLLSKRLYKALAELKYRTIWGIGIKNFSVHTRGQSHWTGLPCLFQGNNPFGMNCRNALIAEVFVWKGNFPQTDTLPQYGLQG